MSNVSTIVSDAGNSYLKSKIAGAKEGIHAIPHAIRFLDGGSWENEAKAAKRGSRQIDREQTKIFWMRGRGAIVGKRAFVANYTAPKIGEGKYSKDYIRYLVAAQLLHHYPNGHDNIDLRIAHPPNAIPYLEDLMRSVGGSYKITLPDGTKVSYLVKQVSTWDEPSGSMYTFLSKRNNGDYNSHDLNDGDTIFLCDFGGRISSMTTVEVRKTANGKYKLIPYFDDNDLSVTFEGGAQTIMLTLAQELKNFNAPQVKEIATKLDRQFMLLEDVFRKRGLLTLDGEEYDVSDAFNFSISPFLDLVRYHYQQRGRTAKIVALTGGSTKPLWDYLVNQSDNVISHNNIMSVCPLDDIRFANIKGAEEAFLNE